MSSQSPKLSQPRLKDVARASGVSETTASMVFNNNGRISEDTRQTVLDAAHRLGYTHQQREKRKNSKGSHVALLMVTDRENSFLWHFLSEMVVQIERDLVKIGLNAVLIPISLHESDESIYRKIESLGCKAVFSISAGKKVLFEKLEENGIPLIVIMNSNFQDNFFSISVDDFQGSYEGVRHLIGLGHKRIGFIDDYRENLPALSSDRYFGYFKAMTEGRLAIREEHRFRCSDSCEGEIEHFNRLFAQPDPPTAFFCLDDEVAFRAWNALTKLGYRIPEDISLLAPGDVLDYNKPYIPDISTMRINMTDLGKMAVNMLQNRINHNPETNQVLKVIPQLNERGSCAPPAVQ